MSLRVLLLLPLLAACQVEAEDPCADGPMTWSPEGLFVTEAEHGEAWGEDDCFACHVEAVLHRTGCTPEVDLDEVRAQVRTEGVASCAECHGDNGVVP